jgi:conjugative relaxase-like TrwC/TraI family protein
VVFVPRKFQAKQIARVGGDLWGYLQGGREQADYYLAADGTPSEATAELHGRLWARLGLAKLDRVAFERLVAGCHPVTGQRLIKTSYVSRLDPVTGERVVAGGFHVPGIDCNLSPPKSVSALLPFLPRGRRVDLERAHLAAVKVTLEELEARVAACRPTVNGEQVHTHGELGVAVFTHHTSRPTVEVVAEPGRPPDPQLHSHAFVFNLAFCQGRYLAVDSRPIYQFAATAEAIYSCQLAAEVQRLGYRLTWRLTPRARIWELAGVDRRLVELFSSRHRCLDQQVAAFQRRRGRPPTVRERGQMAARDRRPKTEACRMPHWPAYGDLLDRHGLQAPAVRRGRPQYAPATEREAMVRARLLAPDGLTGLDATFDQATLTKAVYQAATGLLNAREASEFLQRFTAGPELIPVAAPEGPRYTTALLLAQEQQIVQTARVKAATRVLAPGPELVARVVELAGLAGRRLSQEQQAALEWLAAPVGWASLEGHAGTGKTTLVRTLVRAYQANGQPVVLVATAAETARRTATELGLERGWTVEAFTRAVDAGQLQPRAEWVVLVEEAAMMDTYRIATLLAAAGPASIRTLGDPEQAQPVGAGGWHQLVDQAIGGHAALTTVIRQRHRQDREVCAAIRNGHAAQALADLQARGRLHLSTDRSTAIKELVHAWDRQRHARGLEGVAIVTDTDNATIDTLNALCQAKRRAARELPGPAVTITDQVTGRCELLHVGDRVRFVRPYLDRESYGGYVANGTGGRVRTVDPTCGQVVVDCDDGRAIALKPAALEGAQALRLGYASHALKLQGGQAAVVLVLPGCWQTSRQSAYSMATRCVEELHVFVDTETQQTGLYRDTDPVQALGERWTRDAGKLAASIQRYDQCQRLGTDGRSTVGDGSLLAPPQPFELAASRALEPAVWDAPDDLGIDL